MLTFLVHGVVNDFITLKKSEAESSLIKLEKFKQKNDKIT